MLPKRLDDANFSLIVAAAAVRLKEYGYVANNRSLNIIIQDIIAPIYISRLRHLPENYVKAVLEDIAEWVPNVNLHHKLKFTVLRKENLYE